MKTVGILILVWFPCVPAINEKSASRELQSHLPTERSLSKCQGQVRIGYRVPGKSKEEERQGCQQGEEKHAWAPTPSPEMGLRGLASWRSLVTLTAIAVLAEACFVQWRWVGSNRREWCGL